METTVNILKEWSRTTAETDTMVNALGTQYYEYAEEYERNGNGHYYVDHLTTLQIEVEDIANEWHALKVWANRLLDNVDSIETYTECSQEILVEVSEFAERLVHAANDMPWNRG